MNAKKAVKEIMSEKNISGVGMASAIGVTQQCLWDRLNGKNKSLKISILNEMLKYLGYEIAIVPCTMASNIKGARVIEE
jgi:DNA-binding Xre family transcriptional regulator